MGQLNRITQQPDVLGARHASAACASQSAWLLAKSVLGIVLMTYPYLEREDIMQVLRYAAWRAEEREVMLPAV